MNTTLVAKENDWIEGVCDCTPSCLISKSPEGIGITILLCQLVVLQISPPVVMTT